MGNTVLITGAAGGLGAAIAEYLAEAGYHLTLHYRKSKDATEALAENLRSSDITVRTLQFDVQDREQCREVLENDIAENGVYYGVVLNAGMTCDNTFVAMKGEDWDSVLDTNLGGFYNVLQPIILPMVQSRKAGRIVSMASVSGLIGNRGQVNYSASKAGIIGASKSLAIELAKRKITVNCVAPGLIDTDMVSDEVLEHALPMIPMNRMGTPQEVAAVVAFLLSESAAYITRQVISVNGGLI